MPKDFPIEIPEDLLGAVHKKPPSYFSISIDDSDVVAVACTIRELLSFIHKEVSP